MHANAKEAQTINKSAPLIVRFLTKNTGRETCATGLLRDGDEGGSWAAFNQQERRIAMALPDRGVELLHRVHWLTVDRLDYVALGKADFRGVGGCVDLRNHKSVCVSRQLQLPVKLGAQRLDGDAGNGAFLTVARREALLVFLAVVATPCVLIRQFSQRHVSGLFVTVTVDLEVDPCPGRHSGDLETELVYIGNGAAIDGGNHVAHLQTGVLGRRARVDMRDGHALQIGIAEPFGDITSDLLGQDSDGATAG